MAGGDPTSMLWVSFSSPGSCGLTLTATLMFSEGSGHLVEGDGFRGEGFRGEWVRHCHPKGSGCHDIGVEDCSTSGMGEKTHKDGLMLLPTTSEFSVVEHLARHCGWARRTPKMVERIGCGGLVVVLLLLFLATESDGVHVIDVTTVRSRAELYASRDPLNLGHVEGLHPTVVSVCLTSSSFLERKRGKQGKDWH
jgi:hypothetical protein